MIKKIVVCSLTAIMAMATLFGCGGGDSADSTTPPVVPPADLTQTLSSAKTTAAATAGADIFKLTAPDVVASGYEATISGGFKAGDKISYPVGSARPAALSSVVNETIDGNVNLTWNSNGKEVVIHLTGLDAVIEGTLQSSLPEAAALIYTTY